MAKIPEGAFSATITGVDFVDSNFPNADPSDFRMVIALKDDHGDTGSCDLDFSKSFGRGPYADRTQIEISLETLAKVGWPEKFGVADAMDISQMDKIVGTQVEGNCKVNQKKQTDGTIKEYTNYYIGRATLSKNEVMKRFAQMRGVEAPPEVVPNAATGNQFAQVDGGVGEDF